MKPLEEELRSALRRKEAPEGFAQRVAARAGRETAGRPAFAARLRALLRARPLAWAAAALAAALLVWGGARYRQEQRARAQARLAGAQARVALQIAGAKLNAVLRDAARPPSRAGENQD